MNRKSLDDTCDIFLSRRVRSPLTNQRAASEFPHYAQALSAESIGIPPYLSLELPPTASTAAPAKPLPLPGSSGAVQTKPTRLANGRHHVPRPRNPFILFRCDLVHQRKALPRSDLDDTNISRIAGDLWREMTAAQKKPWVELAAQEKARHALLYPDYKYSPIHSGSKSKKTKDDYAFLEEYSKRPEFRIGGVLPPDRLKQRSQHERPWPYPQIISRRRSSSCPPVGAVPVPSRSQLEGWAPTFSQDDMQRRQGQAIMYQSVASQPIVEQTAPMPASSDPSLPLQGLDWLTFPPAEPFLLDPVCALPELSQNPESCAASNCGLLDYEPTFSPDAGNPGFTLDELKDMERLAIGPTFSILANIPVDNDSSPYTFTTAISSFDYSGYSTGSPSLGTLPFN